MLVTCDSIGEIIPYQKKNVFLTGAQKKYFVVNEQDT